MSWKYIFSIYLFNLMKYIFILEMVLFFEIKEKINFVKLSLKG